jgi:hypothetical protein
MQGFFLVPEWLVVIFHSPKSPNSIFNATSQDVIISLFPDRRISFNEEKVKVCCISTQ